jgi:hypothetical protein
MVIDISMHRGSLGHHVSVVSSTVAGATTASINQSPNVARFVIANS